MSPEENLLEEIFSKEGSLARLFGAFEERGGQIAMARAVLKTYQDSSSVLIEAGTGVGKSLAYLVSAVIWAMRHQQKTVISTHTIALQEQLLKKDIPFLLHALGADLKAVLVKGMGNYLCLRKIEERPDHPLVHFSQKAHEGCRSEIAFPISREAWDEVKAESLSCNHVHCPHYRNCFFFKARREAEDAQLLVVNHHLLLTDVALKQKKRKGEDLSILPSYSHLIVDEAHHLEPVALQCLSDRVDGLLLIRALAPLFSEKHRVFLQNTLSPDKYRAIAHRIEIDLPAEKHLLTLLIDEAFKQIRGLFLSQTRVRLRQEREPLKEKFLSLAIALTGFAQGLTSLAQEIEEKSAIVELINTSLRLEESAVILERFFEAPDSLDEVRLAESTAQSTALVETGLDVSFKLQEGLFKTVKSAVLCSATLAANRDFTYVRSRLGILEGREEIYDSPFDYAGRTLFAIPNDLPDPSSPLFLTTIPHQIRQLLLASKGGAFVLFTSYEMLNAVYEQIYKTVPFPCLRQQEASRTVLLQRFKATPGSVLFGADSFWEGVDVPGDALRSVIIVKLPFKVPSEPIEEAQKEALTAQKKDPFKEKNIPEAVVRFKQGFGRLMRTTSDGGSIICLDNRLLTKKYGKYFLNSLPPSPTLFDTSERVLAGIRAFHSPYSL